MVLTQWPRVRFLVFTIIYFKDAEIYEQHWVEESGQRLENVMASGKLVLKKSNEEPWSSGQRSSGQSHYLRS